VEVDQLLAHLGDHLDLLGEEPVESGHVGLHVRAGLVHVVQQSHLVLDHVNHFVNVPSVACNELLFLLKDLLDQPLVLPT
jgi:hypothetical protein